MHPQTTIQVQICTNYISIKGMPTNKKKVTLPLNKIKDQNPISQSCLSRNNHFKKSIKIKEDTSNKCHMWYGILAGNLILVSLICLQLYEIEPCAQYNRASKQKILLTSFLLNNEVLDFVMLRLNWTLLVPIPLQSMCLCSTPHC